MDHVFAEGELSGAVIFFQTLGLKRKAKRKRLINAEFCAILKKVLKPNGFFGLKLFS